MDYRAFQLHRRYQAKNQHQASIQELAVFTVRTLIADSALVMQGKVESISEDYARMNWATARLAVVQPIRTFKGDASTKYEVLVPIDAQLSDEVLVFANLENSKEIQLRVDWNSRSLKPNLKWTQSRNPLWLGSTPCVVRTYSTNKSPEIAAAVKQVFSSGSHAELSIESRVYSPSSRSQPHLNPKFDLSKKLEFINSTGNKVSSRISKKMSEGLFTTVLNDLPQGKYSLSPPKIPGMRHICNLDLQDWDCSSIEIKSYATQKLLVVYHPSAQINLNQLSSLIESVPIEYEFVALDAQVRQPSIIRHVSGIGGDIVFLYPGKYKLFAVLVGGTPSKDRRIQITQNGNKVFQLNAGLNKISVAISEFIEPVETTVKWQLPTDTTEAVSTSFQLLANVNGYGRVYQKSAYSSCNNNECKLIALRGQSIEVTAAAYKSGLTAKKILNVGDENTINLDLTPTKK